MITRPLVDTNKQNSVDIVLQKGAFCGMCMMRYDQKVEEQADHQHRCALIILWHSSTKVIVPQLPLSYGKLLRIYLRNTEGTTSDLQALNGLHLQAGGSPLIVPFFHCCGLIRSVNAFTFCPDRPKCRSSQKRNCYIQYVLWHDFFSLHFLFEEGGRNPFVLGLFF